MTYYGGAELERVYEDALVDDFALVASNVAETNVLIGLIEGASRADSHLLVQLSNGACTFAGNGDPVAGLQLLGGYVERVANQYDVGVFLNMDHQTDLDVIRRQVDLGIPSSIMVDASHEPFEENVARSREVVETVERAGADILVEAELGRIKGTEDEIVSEEALYTDPEQAVEFVERTGCDLLAVSVGTQHGVAKGRDVELRPELVGDIRTALADHGLDVPLVLHGSSGLQPDQLRDVIERGVCKVNKDTRYQYEYTRTAFDLYRENADAIVPPEETEGDRDAFFNDVAWSPDKDAFDPRVAGRRIRERIATVYGDLAEVAGSSGRSRYR